MSGVDAIYVTQFQRTQQTATPLATDHGVTPMQKDIAVDIVTAIRARPTSSTSLVIGHTNTCPKSLSNWAVRQV
jgi:hypothetical protein